MKQPYEDSSLVTKVRIRPETALPFADWQAKFNAKIASFPGFLSLEILSPSASAEGEWVLVQRFYKGDKAEEWHSSKEYAELLKEVEPFLLLGDPHALREEKMQLVDKQSGVTEVFVTQVSPDKVVAYRDWTAKIHQAEAKFPGFRGVYVQAPTPGRGHDWITLLQFDTTENLDRWLSSPERQAILQESSTLVAALDSHRVISPYAGWFASFSKQGVFPPAWKQGMLVLLVLFPIVMLESKYLNPRLASLNPSLGTFIGNSISVALVTWPLMPFAIKKLRWWLSIKDSEKFGTMLMGLGLVLGLYLLEILLLWKLM